MTSLRETLPILDQAVPGLPGKVEAVAREAEAFEKAARDMVAAFQSRRAAADELIEDLRHALEALRDQAGQHRARVDEAARELGTAAADEANGLADVTEALLGAGEQAGSALDVLQSRLAEGGARTRAAQEDALAALGTLDENTRSGQADLQQAAEQVTAAIGDVKAAIDEGQAAVAEGVNALAEAVSRMAERVQGRLERTLRRLDELSDEQETEIAEIVEQLENGREQIEQDVNGRLDGLVSEGVDPELEAASAALAQLATEVGQADADLEARLETLDADLQAVGDRVEPLQGSVAQVKQAADQVGLQWP